MADPLGVLDPYEDERAEWRARTIGRALAGLVALGVMIAYAAEGLRGLMLALTFVAVVVIVVGVSTTPGAPPRRVGGRHPVPVAHAPYRSYREVAERLSWAHVSPRHYDHVTRPMLVQLLESRLADRHRVELRHSPDQARALVGEDVWPWLDPDRQPDRSSQPPGVDLPTLSRIVQALERL
jgi:hypothetical protein